MRTFIIATSSLISVLAFAADPSPEAIKKPSAPPVLGAAVPPDIFYCERQYVYRDKLLRCDSDVQHDGERLRPILEKSPEALQELNTYQKNRREFRGSSYLTTAALFFAVGSYFYCKTTNQTDQTRTIMVGSGLLAGAGSFIYGLSLIKNNETHLGRAVDLYNGAYPKDPIRLQFTTGIAF